MSDCSHLEKVYNDQVKVVDENLHQNKMVDKGNLIVTNLSSEHDVTSLNHEQDKVDSRISPSNHESNESTCEKMNPILCSETELSTTESGFNGHLNQTENSQPINNETIANVSVDTSSENNSRSDSLSKLVSTELTSERTNGTSASLSDNPEADLEVKFPGVGDLSKNFSNKADIVFSSKSMIDSNDNSVESKNNHFENLCENQDVSETNINTNLTDFENRNGSNELTSSCPSSSQIDEKPEDSNLSVEDESKSASKLPFSKESTSTSNNDKSIKVTFSTSSTDESHNLELSEQLPNSDTGTNSLNENCLNADTIVEETANQQTSDSVDKMHLCAIDISSKAVLTESSSLTSSMKSDSLTEDIHISNINDIECVSASDCDQKELNQITISSSPSIETVGEEFSQGEVNSLPKSATTDNLEIKNKIQIKGECGEGDFEDIIYLDKSLLDQNRKDQVKSFRRLGIKHCQVNLGSSRIKSHLKSKDVEKPNFNKLKRKLEDMMHSAQQQEDNAMKQLKKMRLEKSNMLQDIVKEIQKIKKKFLV